MMWIQSSPLGECSQCPAGQIAGSAGQPRCTRCEIGTFAPTTGLQSCVPCPVGSISNSPGAITCTGCPAGTYAPVTGSVACLDCPVGRYGQHCSADRSSDLTRMLIFCCDNNTVPARSTTPHRAPSALRVGFSQLLVNWTVFAVPPAPSVPPRVSPTAWSALWVVSARPLHLLLAPSAARESSKTRRARQPAVNAEQAPTLTRKARPTVFPARLGHSRTPLVLWRARNVPLDPSALPPAPLCARLVMLVVSAPQRVPSLVCPVAPACLSTPLAGPPVCHVLWVGSRTSKESQRASSAQRASPLPALASRNVYHVPRVGLATRPTRRSRLATPAPLASSKISLVPVAARTVPSDPSTW